MSSCKKIDSCVGFCDVKSEALFNTFGNYLGLNIFADLKIKLNRKLFVCCANDRIALTVTIFVVLVACGPSGKLLHFVLNYYKNVTI